MASYQGMWFRITNRPGLSGVEVYTDWGLVDTFREGDTVVGLDCYSNPVSPKDEIERLMVREEARHERYMSGLRAVLQSLGETSGGGRGP